MKIVINNLKKSYKNNIVFNKVNITFESGYIYGLVGRNGSGKSVLLKTICGFVKPDSGNVLINDVDILKNGCFIPNTGAMIERPTFISGLSGFNNLKLLASVNNKINDDIIINWLKKVGLDSEKDKKYDEYSLGMKQKLGIVQAIMEDPDIIILDEPFNGLDKESYKNMLEIFKEEKSKGKLIIIATHIATDINDLCDIVYEIDNGTIKQAINNI